MQSFVILVDGNEHFLRFVLLRKKNMFEQPENENAKIIEQDQTIFIVYLLLRKKHV